MIMEKNLIFTTKNLCIRLITILRLLVLSLCSPAVLVSNSAICYSTIQYNEDIYRVLSAVRTRLHPAVVN